jgi:DnaJ-class molecular chaperone
MKDCPHCHGEGHWHTLSHPDAEVDTEWCKTCRGSGDFPDFDGAGIA